MKMLSKLFILISISLSIISCSEYLAIKSQDKKSPLITNEIERNEAINYFWQEFLTGNYNNIDKMLIKLKSAYLKNPNDPKLPLLIAHTHFWKVAERFRDDNHSPNITDNLTIAIKYFKEAKKLNPKDYRIDGWLSGAQMAEASIHNDKIDQVKAYFKGLEAIDNYPEFNYFSIGYVFSNFDWNDEKFQDAISWYYKSMDLAYHTKVNRENPIIDNYLHLEQHETNKNLKKAVWNSKIAPHNVEGFYLNFGDFLVKNNELEKAKIIYNNAKKISSYNTWQYKNILESRLKNINENVNKFRKNIKNGEKLTKNIINNNMIFHSYNCSVCHQK